MSKITNKSRHVKISEGENKITVVALHKNKEISFGVARCGNNEEYDEELGTNIAAHRAKIAPYFKVDMPPKVTIKNMVEVVAKGIIDNIRRQKQWSASILREDKKTKKKK